VIRTGPREVAVYCADAVPLIHGPTSRCRKPTIYTSIHGGGVSVHSERSKQAHGRRRRVWDQAFSAKALRDYEPRLNRHALALMSQLKEQVDQPSVRISDWMNFYSFDVMGDVGFNRSFDMVENGEEADVIKLLHESTGVLSIFAHIGWALKLVSRTSAGAKPLVEHVKWSADVLKGRVKVVFLCTYGRQANVV
jgi:cytochrome P450